jgi:2-polyprenyl-3-methyl-5-hydroxy-6-metoxy-1,4-benzoquinol methylase
MNFTNRSDKKELLDRNDIPAKDIQRNMAELDMINTYLGGHKISVDGVKQLIGDRKTISICEIGCGGGDNLHAIAKWCWKHNIDVSLTGIDLNPYCIEVAKKRFNDGSYKFICSDFRSVEMRDKPDIIFSSLFCHHFDNESLQQVFRWSAKNAQTGFFINDLHRHPLAYYAIKIITAIFSKSYLVKNDAPLSVLRGFKKPELVRTLKQSGISNASIEWKWAFRWLVVFDKTKAV